MTTTDAADRVAALRNRGPAAATAKVIVTGAALALTGVLVTGMGIDRVEPASPPAPAPVPVAVPVATTVTPAPVTTTGAS